MSVSEEQITEPENTIIEESKETQDSPVEQEPKVVVEEEQAPGEELAQEPDGETEPSGETAEVEAEVPEEPEPDEGTADAGEEEAPSEPEAKVAEEEEQTSGEELAQETDGETEPSGETAEVEAEVSEEPEPDEGTADAGEKEAPSEPKPEAEAADAEETTEQEIHETVEELKSRTDEIRTVKLSELEEMAEGKSAPDLDLEELYSKHMHNISEGDVTTGTVLSVNDNEVVVDIGFKSEGIVSIEEFAEGTRPNVGDSIEVFLDRLEDDAGQLVLSKKKADFMRIWEKIVEASNEAEIVEGRVLRRIKGGMVVDLMGIDAFLPGSQIDVKPIQDFDQYVGKTLQFKIVKLNEARKNVVVSRRELIEEDLKLRRKEFLSGIEVGQILEGHVKNITDFGVFVDLGGVDGLLHITDLSWGRIGHPSEIVSMDEDIKVKVLDYAKDTNRISLGYKQLQPHPWENVEERYPVDSMVKGKIVSITNYGAFVELEKGVEGLIHISEMSWTQHIKHPSNVVSLGEMIEAKVLKVAPDDKKISLGIKQLEPDPWENIEEKYKVGTIHKGEVRNLTQFGAFVELEEGIEGLVHVSDLSWTKKVRHPKEVVSKGNEIEVMILDISRENRRISLGHKQVSENPWPLFEEKYGLDMLTEGEVLKVLDKGVTVSLPESGEGFVPLSKLTGHRVRRASEIVSEGETLNLKVIEFSKEDKKIILSYTDYLVEVGEEEPADRLELAKEKKAKEAEDAAAAETGAKVSTEEAVGTDEETGKSESDETEEPAAEEPAESEDSEPEEAAKPEGDEPEEPAVEEPVESEDSEPEEAAKPEGDEPEEPAVEEPVESEDSEPEEAAKPEGDEPEEPAAEEPAESEDSEPEEAAKPEGDEPEEPAAEEPADSEDSEPEEAAKPEGDEKSDDSVTDSPSDTIEEKPQGEDK